VVATSSLPPWIGSFHMVEVVTNPTADGLAVNNITNIYLGSGNSAFDDWNTPVPGQNTFDITINDPTTNVSAMIANLTASGLFQSITEKA
jgi:hypothetical protein